MADVFVSYKRDDRARVAPIVEALRREGLSVWWDQDIPLGAPWETTIERELTGARIAMVAWSPAAVASDAVKSEARFARTEGKLIQLFVAPCLPPLFFGERQGIDLSGWTGDIGDPRFQAVAGAAKAMLAGRPAPDGVGYAPRARRRPTRAIAAAVVVVVVAAVALLLHLRGSTGSPPVPTRGPSHAQVSPRRALLNSLAGNWDRQNGRCTAPISISTAVDAARGDVINVRTKDGFQSVGAIIAVENGAVISRDMSVNQSGRREQWEYRPVGNDMTVIDGTGVATKLVRCRAPQANQPHD